METQQRIEDYFSHLGREMPRNNLKQAMVPENARLFPNENGTAPGLAVQKAGKCVILLPGPPRELVPMYRPLTFPCETFSRNLPFSTFLNSKDRKSVV